MNTIEYIQQQNQYQIYNSLKQKLNKSNTTHQLRHTHTHARTHKTRQMGHIYIFRTGNQKSREHI
jgi:hypothetical protein